MVHVASAITLVRELVGNRHLPIRVGCCSLTTLIPRSVTTPLTPQEPKETPGLGKWDVIVEADAHFLDGGVERDWGFEDVEGVYDAGPPEIVGEELQDSFGLQVRLPSATSPNSPKL